MTKPQKPQATVVLLLLAFLIIAVDAASANPQPTPLIDVYAPVNNHIYPSGSIVLNFSVSPVSYVNFTEFTYCLDGEPWTATNGTTLLTGLASGSHTLTIRGVGVYDYWGAGEQTYDSTVAIIYFSVSFSTAWMVVGASVAAALCITAFVLFKTRTKIAAALRRQKRQRFWVGVAGLIVGGLVFVYAAVKLASDYLYPYYPHNVSAIELFPDSYSAIFGLILMGAGLGCMWKGTIKPRTRHNVILPPT